MTERNQNPFGDLANPSNDSEIEEINRARRLKRLLVKKELLSEDELRSILTRLVDAWELHPPPDFLTARLVVELMFTVRRMDEASTKAATSMIRLTWAIIGLTVLIAVLTGAMLLKGS